MQLILIVDDAIENVRLLKNLLQDMARVVFAHDGLGALELAAHHRPDLILLDVMMPRLDGYQTCVQLKEDPATRDSPVIFITGADADSDEERGLAAGAIDYITKPFAPAIVRSRVKNHLALVAANAALRGANESLRKFKAAVDCSSAAVVIANAEARIEYVNAAYAADSGVAREQLLGQIPFLLTAQAQAGGGSVRDAVLGGDSWRGELSLAQPGGALRWHDVSCAPVYDEAGRVSHIVAVHADVTERRAMEEELRRLSVTDSLTGVANRRHLMALGEREIERRRRSTKPLSLLMLDIDHFKRVNDTYGHPAGDCVIRAVASRCAALLRSTDTVGRIGGEEFAIMLPMTPLAAAHELAERIRREIAAKVVPWEDTGIAFTVSIGLAQVNDNSSDFASLVGRADAALYAAKQGGRNRTVKASRPGDAQ
ncbi:diguanylate cyclase [Massilia glaciei]|uniref:diguanylate cyclase n=1 Tax=Massilia glaciei TaxID=1524097 RepID=A0A2U2I6R8_9BURK|nr:diguanylate cyclase [Massilia glaciei]PWF55319.1 GGDEF domain-containing protein [Massilia glaciei]